MNYKNTADFQLMEANPWDADNLNDGSVTNRAIKAKFTQKKLVQQYMIDKVKRNQKEEKRQQNIDEISHLKEILKGDIQSSRSVSQIDN